MIVLSITENLLPMILLTNSVPSSSTTCGCELIRLNLFRLLQNKSHYVTREFNRCWYSYLPLEGITCFHRNVYWSKEGRTFISGKWFNWITSSFGIIISAIGKWLILELQTELQHRSNLIMRPQNRNLFLSLCKLLNWQADRNYIEVPRMEECFLRKCIRRALQAFIS